MQPIAPLQRITANAQSGKVIADLPLGHARAVAAGGDDWRTTLRPYWLDRLRFLRGEASFAAARRLCHLLAVAASGPAWRSASAYESLDRDRRRGSSPAASEPVEAKLFWHHRFDACGSSPCFPDTAAGSSNASHEVLSPTALSGCVALSRGGQPFRDGPASTFVAPALVPARVVLAVFQRRSRILDWRIAAPFAEAAARGGSCIAGSLQAMFRYPLITFGPCRSLAATVAAALMGLFPSQS